MTTADLLRSLRALGIRLSAEDGSLRVAAPPGVLTPELRRALQENKAEMLALLTGGTSEATPVQIEPVSRAGHLPLSSFQRRLWVLDQLHADTSAYHLSAWQTWDLAFDEAALERSLSSLTARHEILRTNFHLKEERPGLAIQEPGRRRPVIIDMMGEEAEDREGLLRRVAEEEARVPLDLSKSSLFRSSAIRLDPESFAIVLTVHHIITDAWSLGLILSEWKDLYLEELGESEPSDRGEALQYVDFSAWEQGFLRSDEAARQESFWLDYLRGAPTQLALPSDHPRGAVQSFEGNTHLFELDDELRDGVKRLCAAEGITPFMLWLAGFGLLLSRYSAQSDFLIGTASGARPAPWLESVLGPFVTTLVVRFRLKESDTVRTLLARIKEDVLAIHAHTAVPFERLVEIIPTERTMARPPLFQVSCGYHNQPGRSDFGVSTGGSMFELTLNGLESDHGLTGSIEYSSALFEEDTIRRMGDHFRRLLRAMVSNPKATALKLPMISAAERRTLTNGENQHWPPQSPPPGVLAEFDKRVREHPDAPAVSCGETTVSYAELNQRIESLRAELEARGFQPGDSAGVLLPRSIDMVAAPLAVFRAGGSYVPLDPEYPKARTSFILADSGARFLFTTKRISKAMEGLPAETIDVDAPALSEPTLFSRETGPSTPPGPDDLAYVIYTSGTTGKPKGVEVTHRGLGNILASMGKDPGLGPGDSLLAVTTFAFDIAAVELFLPLMNGGTVRIAPAAVAEHGKKLLDLMAAAPPDVMQATPATWQMLLDAGWGSSGPHLVKRIWCGGDALPRPLADALLERAEEVWNLYGPTETSIWSTLQRVEPGPDPVPIGGPFENTRLFVLDDALSPVPVGAPGELFIGGSGIARGYRNLPDLTEERFVQNPIFPSEEGCVYRTGDLVRWKNPGTLEYLGRIDQQVKVRGHRIELGEIESVLLGHPSVQAAAASVWEGRIVAYVVHEPGVQETASEIRKFLREALPEYMIPGFVVPLRSLPMTENRKLDRKALPHPQGGDGPLRARPFEPPEGDRELAIAEIWMELLGEDLEIGADDNFFELGGHSLLALQAVYRIEHLLGKPVETRAIFVESLRQLAAR